MRAIRSHATARPYSVRFGKKDRTLHYIVAVATREKYRGRGIYEELLKHRPAKCTVTGSRCYMPAAEAIYYPHGFRFVYRQRQIDGKVKDGLVGEGTVHVRPPCQTAMLLAPVCGGGLRVRQEEWVRAVRTEEYYRDACKEQQSEGGRILSLSVKDRSGFVLYGYWEGKAELREPFVYQEKDWQSLAAFLEKEPVDELHITEYSHGWSRGSKGVSPNRSKKRCADDYGADCAFGTVSRKFSNGGKYRCWEVFTVESRKRLLPVIQIEKTRETL